MMETFTFTQFSPDRSKAYVALYTDVRNAGELRKRIVDASGAEGEEGERQRDAVNFAFIDARLVMFPSIIVYS
jgi:EKC/KEOPS complex subunit CGI121/TPRKB